MADESETADDPDQDLRLKKLAVRAAILLGIATIFSAWGAYQAARWSGAMTTHFNEALAMNNDAGKLFAEGDGEYNLDQTLFVEVVIALQVGNSDLAVYIEETLFSDQMSVAYTAWSATDESGPDTPFEMDEYVVSQWVNGDALEVQAEALSDEARENNQTSDNYVLLTVALASALFFAGMASTVRQYDAARILFGIGCVVLVTAAGTMATQPIL